mgnify:CR=1 FL=1
MYVHGHALFICQLPNCNLFTQHAVYLMGETPLVNCGPRSILLHRIQSTAILVLLFSANNHHPHYTSNPLLQQAGEIDNLTVSLGQSTLVVLCRFHVGAGIPGVAPHYIPPPSTFNVLLGSYWFDNLGFILRETCRCMHHTFLLWLPTDACCTRIKLFFWRRCRGDQDTLQGESPLLNLFTLFLSCLVLFTTLFAALNQNTKKLVASFTLFAILFAISKTQKN